MRAVLPLAALCLASCGGETQPPTASQLDLRALGAPEVEQYGIYGYGCAFAPGDGIESLYLTDKDKAYIKVGEKVVQLAKMDGGPRLPSGEWENYSGGGYSVSLTVSGKQPAKGDYDAHFTVRGDKGTTVYEANGRARCSD